MKDFDTWEPFRRTKLKNVYRNKFKINFEGRITILELPYVFV